MPMLTWLFCGPWTPGIRCAAFLAEGGVRPHPRPVELCGHQLGLAVPGGDGARLCCCDPRRRCSRRLQGDGQRPWPRCFSGRAGRAGKTAPVDRICIGNRSDGPKEAFSLGHSAIYLRQVIGRLPSSTPRGTGLLRTETLAAQPGSNFRGNFACHRRQWLSIIQTNTALEAVVSLIRHPGVQPTLRMVANSVGECVSFNLDFAIPRSTA